MDEHPSLVPSPCRVVRTLWLFQLHHQLQEGLTPASATEILGKTLCDLESFPVGYTRLTSSLCHIPSCRAFALPSAEWWPTV